MAVAGTFSLNWSSTANGAAAESAAAAAAEAADTAQEGRGTSEGEASEEAPPTDPRRPWRGTKPAIEPLSGISEEQARRIRDAVRRNRRRPRDDDAGD